MPKAQRRLSKGMRRHIRLEKAKEEKKKSLIETGKARQAALERATKEKERLDKLPDFLTMPVAESGGSIFYTESCPKCGLSSLKERKQIDTKQGVKSVYLCQNCGTYFRSK